MHKQIHLSTGEITMLVRLQIDEIIDNHGLPEFLDWALHAARERQHVALDPVVWDNLVDHLDKAVHEACRIEEKANNQ